MRAKSGTIRRSGVRTTSLPAAEQAPNPYGVPHRWIGGFLLPLFICEGRAPVLAASPALR